MSRPCSVCLHPRREEAENLLQQGLSIRRIASEIGVGAAALHRHWRRHVANRDAISAVDPAMSGNETAVPGRPEKAPNVVSSSCVSIADIPRVAVHSVGARSAADAVAITANDAGGLWASIPVVNSQQWSSPLRRSSIAARPSPRPVVRSTTRHAAGQRRHREGQPLLVSQAVQA